MTVDHTPGPPPNYVSEGDTVPEGSAHTNDPQIVILPATDALRFQQGYLGADGERPAIEGELQIKSSLETRWSKVTIGLRTVETAYDHLIELNNGEITLYDLKLAAGAPLPSTMPFAIPLTNDTPLCVHTPQSALTHTLTATLYPEDTALPPLTKSVDVHTRRFSPHTLTLPIAPVTRSLHHPAQINVEIPRTTFFATEPVPVYVTVPSPRRELVVDEGLRLRNIKAELVRMVHVHEAVTREDEAPGEMDDADQAASEHDDGAGRESSLLGISLPATAHDQADLDKLAGPSTSSSAFARTPFHRDDGTMYKTVLSRSGALCRFHTSLPVRLRFVLQQSSPTPSPSHTARTLPGECGPFGSDTQCASITQATLLHAVSFRLRVLVTFRHTSTHTERVSTLSIPIEMLPPPAPLPEVEESVDFAYHKKHDAPPARTVRGEEADAAPHYEEGHAGPSYVASGAPPPFEERDAPPPSFQEASTSRLPTFLESEQNIFVPDAESPDAHHERPPTARRVIDGEGTLFGFPATAQFSGHSDEMTRGGGDATPPPTLEQATLDANVTELARLDLGAPERAMQALGLALVQHEEASADGEPLPPPPPPLDDPTDPPPSIDQAYHSREGVAHQTTNIMPPPPSTLPAPASHGGSAAASLTHAPPPYLVPEGDREQENVSRPPPYVDFVIAPTDLD